MKNDTGLINLAYKFVVVSTLYVEWNFSKFGSYKIVLIFIFSSMLMHNMYIKVIVIENLRHIITKFDIDDRLNFPYATSKLNSYTLHIKESFKLRS